MSVFVNKIKGLRLVVFFGALSLLAGCGGGGGGEELEEDEAFAEAIPNDDILGVDVGAESGQGLTLEQGLEGEPSRIAEHAVKTANRIKAAREATHEVVEQILSGEGGEQVEVGGLDCRVFKKDIGEQSWKLSSCLKQARAKRFVFKLEGAAQGSSDFVIVMAGEGAVLPRAEGKRRGAGRIGYNLDALNTLTGEGPTGKVAIGYRAAGRFRQVVAAFKGFKAAGSDEDFSAVYRFRQVIGRGGSLKFIFKADVLSVDNGTLSEDSDGEDEIGRVSMAFSRAGRARVAAVACGGSLGQRCVHVRECFETDGVVTFGSLVQEEGDLPQFDATACPGEADLPFPEDEPPSEGEVEPDDGDNGGDIPGPAVEEPSADATQEG